MVTLREERPRVTVQLELEKRRCGLGVRGSDACSRLSAAISSPLACGTIRPASIWAASAQLARTKSTIDRRVTSGRSSRDTKLPKKTIFRTAPELRAARLAVTTPSTSMRTRSPASASASRRSPSREHPRLEVDRRQEGAGPDPRARRRAGRSARRGGSARAPRRSCARADRPTPPRDATPTSHRRRAAAPRRRSRRRCGLPSSSQKRMSCSITRECSWPERAMSTRWPVVGEVSGHASRLRSSYAVALRQRAHHQIAAGRRHRDRVRAVRASRRALARAPLLRREAAPLGARAREPRTRRSRPPRPRRLHRRRRRARGNRAPRPRPARRRRSRSPSPTSTRAAVSGSILASELAADARAAGITQLMATVCGDNPRILALLQRLGSLDIELARGRARARRRALARAYHRGRVHRPRRDRPRRASCADGARRRARSRRCARSHLVRRSSPAGRDQHPARPGRRGRGAQDPESGHPRGRLLRRPGLRELRRGRRATRSSWATATSSTTQVESGTGRTPASRSSQRSPRALG